MTCKDCGKEICSRATRCHSCAYVHRRTRSYVCVDCGKAIDPRSTRCPSCRNISRVYSKPTEETRRKMSESRKEYYDKVGRKVDPGRCYYDYKIWRKDVLDRDDYTCQHCGSKDKLSTHHMEDYENNPELRTELSNGITLCTYCHDNFHHLFGAQSTRAQVFWFLKNVRLGKGE